MQGSIVLISITKDRRQNNYTLEERLMSTIDRIVLKEDEIYIVLRRMKPSKASGPVGVRLSLLKCCAEQLSDVLFLIFNNYVSSVV